MYIIHNYINITMCICDIITCKYIIEVALYYVLNSIYYIIIR